MTHGEEHNLVDVAKGVKIFRLIPSRYPTIKIFEDILHADELEAAYALESLTNDRLREEVGDISIVPLEDRVVGHGASAIMAAFTHVGVESRFSDGSYGVFYAGVGFEPALEEAKQSQARFLAATNQPPVEITMRCYKATVAEELLDVRAAKFNFLHDPNKWGDSQAFGKEKRAEGEYGLLYRSVRYSGGECVAIFKPTGVLPPALQCAHYRFCWDGSSITHVFKVESLDGGD